jgi:CubicO group peptidase (beta-lactamase class C family)
MTNRPWTNRSVPNFYALATIVVVALLSTASFAEDGVPINEQIFSDALRSAGQMPRLHSLLVSRNGELVVEKYFNGRGPQRAANVKSVSKSIMSALVGIAIDRGHIAGLDQPISEFDGNLMSTKSGTAKDNITVGNLLSMQSGLETTSFYNYGAWVLSDDWIDFALKQPLQVSPGTKLQYSTGNTHLLSAILTEATGKSTLEFAREVLGQPLGFHLAAWPTDPRGVYFGGNNMELTPRQMLAFGELYLNEGLHNGRRVIPGNWIDTSFQPLAESAREEGRFYGYGWWMRDMAGVPTTFAWGYGGQFILLVPDLSLVVVTTSSSLPGDNRRSHIRGLYDLLEYKIVQPLLDSQPANATISTSSP